MIAGDGQRESVRERERINASAKEDFMKSKRIIIRVNQVWSRIFENTIFTFF